MDISIVIPVYRRQDEAIRAIGSALAGGGPWREIIVVDDASPEPFQLTPELAADERIRLIRHDVNQGESGARNTAIDNARCDWIAFLDSDDHWLPGKLERQALFAIEDQHRSPNQLTFYSHGFIQINQTTGRTRALVPADSNLPEDFACGCWFMQGSTVLFHKQAAQAAGPCDINLRRLQDLDWYLRMALAGGRLKVAPFVGAVIEVGARPTPAAMEAACAHMREKWCGPAGRLNRVQATGLAAYLDVERAAASRYAGDYPSCFYFLARSLVTRPRLTLHLRNWWREVDLPPEFSER